MQEQNNNLLELRQKVVNRAKELALNGDGSAQDRLQILMGIARSGNADYDVLSAAFDLSNSLPSDDDKLSALLDILYEIDNMTRNADEVNPGDSANAQQEDSYASQE